MEAKIKSQLPNHIAIIPDGNRRWAQKNNVSLREGHLRGFIQVTPKLFSSAWEHGIHTMTLWAFSTENWNRSVEETSYLMEIYGQFIDHMLELCNRLQVRMNHFGRKSVMPSWLLVKINEAAAATKENSRSVFNLALDYGGRNEIIRALKAAAAELNPEEITEEDLDRFMDTASQPFPNPDIIVRTSGEHRLSGFMPWQSCYSEYYFTNTLYPDFNWSALEQIIRNHKKRVRRFGK
jgi:undecaprenyl diphosphate synthase